MQEVDPLDKLEDIERQIADLQAERKGILDKRRANDLEEARKLVRQHGFTAKDLLIAASVGTKRGPKEKKQITFRDDRDPANILEWDGDLLQKGRKPDWIKQRIAEGSIEEFRVTAATG